MRRRVAAPTTSGRRGVRRRVRFLGRIAAPFASFAPLAAVVAADPDLAVDVLFGARCALAMDGVTARHLLGAWEAGRSALRREPVAA